MRGRTRSIATNDELLATNDIFEAVDSDVGAYGAGRRAVHQAAEPLETASIVFDALLAQGLLHHELLVEVANDCSILLGGAEDGVGREHAAGALAILDDHRRRARQVLRQMPGQDSGVGVETAPRSETDEDTDGFALVELLDRLLVEGYLLGRLRHGGRLLGRSLRGLGRGSRLLGSRFGWRGGWGGLRGRRAGRRGDGQNHDDRKPEPVSPRHEVLLRRRGQPRAACFSAM